MVDYPETQKSDSPPDTKSTSSSSDTADLSKPSVLKFREPVPNTIGVRLLQIAIKDLLPRLQKDYPDVSLNPLYSDNRDLVGIDFFEALNPKLKKTIITYLNKYLIQIQQHDLKEYRGDMEDQGRSGQPTSFLEILGTFRVSLKRYYVPLLICIGVSVLFSWMSWGPAQQTLNASIVSQNTYGFWAAILNGLIPVLISAAFITIIWLVVRKRGLGFFKVLMGIFVLLYNWFGFTYYEYIVATILYGQYFPDMLSYVIYNILYYGSIGFFLFVGIMFFLNKLKVWQKNLLILSFGIFLGSIIGVSLPTWSLFMLMIFFSIWDLIAVFKGPLGKIADILMENRKKLMNQKEESTEYVSGSESSTTAKDKEESVSVGLDELDDKYIKDHLDEIEVEIGSGDLIFYSALVAQTFFSISSWILGITKVTWLQFAGTWFITVLVIFGVILGAYMTLQRLLQNKRVLPALPFSMFIGIGLYFLGQIIVYIAALIVH